MNIKRFLAITFILVLFTLELAVVDNQLIGNLKFRYSRKFIANRTYEKLIGISSEGSIENPISHISNTRQSTRQYTFPRIFSAEDDIKPLSIPNYPRSENKAQYKWTFMVYLDADNNLESAGIEDFLEMSSVGSTSDVAIVVLMDRCRDYNTSYEDWTDAKLFYITNGLKPYPDNAIETWNETNMGDPQTLVNFVTYVVSNYPAEHYVLVLWDHGGGLNGVCWDEDNNDDNLNLYEIRAALETICTNLNITIDILGFDACLMGMIEVAYQLRDYVNYVVFSQEYEPGDGWPYDEILEALVQNPLMTPSDLAKLIAEKYVQSYDYGSQGFDENATMSAINLTHLIKYAFRKLDRFVGELLRNWEIYSPAVNRAIVNAEEFCYTDEKDLIHFLVLLRNFVSDQNLINLINQTLTELNESILYAGHLSGHPNAYGLSAWFPSYYYVEYDNILMSVHHQWDEFVRRITGTPVGLWFYDVILLASDNDGNGYYDQATLYIDMDSDSPQEVYVKIYAWDGTSEMYLGQTELKNINGTTSSDMIAFVIFVGAQMKLTFRFEVYAQNNTLIKQLYYYSDDDTSDIPLEQKVGYPQVKIVNPFPGTTIHGITLIQVNATDSDGIAWVRVKISETWYDMIYNTSTGLYEYIWDTTYHNDGLITITINASDTGGNITSVYVFFTINNIYIEVINPTPGKRLRNTVKIQVNATTLTAEISINRIVAWIENKTYVGQQISLYLNATSGYYEGLLDTTVYADGLYRLIVNATTTHNTSEYVTIYIFIDNIIEPILVVDDDDGENYETYYIQALENLGLVKGKDFDIWSILENGSIDQDVLYGRKVIIWFTGDSYYDTLTENDRQVLAWYLEQGGNLFISGQDIGYDLNYTDPIWYETYLKAIYIADDSGSYYVKGISGTIFAGVYYNLTDGDGADNSFWPDVILPSGSQLVMYYGNNTSLGAAIIYNGTYKLVYFAFPFESINSRLNRRECLKKILRFFGINMPPEIYIVFPTNNSYIGTTTITVTWNAFDENGIDHFEIYLDGETIDTNIPPNQNNYTLTELSIGEHIIEVVAVDTTNKSSSYRILITIDTNSPEIWIVSPKNNSYIPSTTVTIKWSGHDDFALDHYEIKIDDYDWVNVNLATSHVFRNLAEGHHIVKIKAVDKAKNEALVEITFIIDVTPPSLTIKKPGNNSITGDAEITIEWSASDNFGIHHFELCINNGSWTNVYSNTSYTINLREGKNVILIKAVDYAGNEVTVALVIEYSPLINIIPIIIVVIIVIIAVIVWVKKKKS